MKRLGLIVVVLLVAVVLYRPAASRDTYEERISSLETRVSLLETNSGEVAPDDEEETYTIYGMVMFRGQSRLQVIVNGSKCAGTGPYSAFLRGTEIEVRDNRGRLLGRGDLEAGDLENPVDDDDMLAYASCRMPFEVSDLPASETYVISVADTGSYEWDFSFEQLENSNWSIQLGFD